MSEQMKNFFDSVVGKANHLTDAADIAPYNEGWRYGQGDARCVVRPTTAEQVAQVLAFCNERGIGVVPQSARTGLVASGLASKEQILLSLTSLKSEFKSDEEAGILMADAGFLLSAANQKLCDKNLQLAIDLSSDPLLGGLAATNAAGTRAGRYGNAKRQLVKVQLVLADGSIVEEDVVPAAPNRGLLQDNSRIDCNNPFIGSQGTLGIITRLWWKLTPLPARTESVLLVPVNQQAINPIRQAMQEDFGDQFTAFEGMTAAAVDLVVKHTPDTPHPFQGDADVRPEHDYFLLAEVAAGGADAETLRTRLENVMGKMFERGLIATARFDGNDPKTGISQLWHVRHHISTSMASAGEVVACDIAVKPDDLAQFRMQLTAEISERWPQVKAASFGHEMIGAVHFNLVCPHGTPMSITAEDKKKIRRYVYDRTVNDYDGTFSAEHGIGPENQWAYDIYTPQQVKDQARQLKAVHDPKRIMNPPLDYGWGRE